MPEETPIAYEQQERLTAPEAFIQLHKIISAHPEGEVAWPRLRRLVSLDNWPPADPVNHALACSGLAQEYGRDSEEMRYSFFNLARALLAYDRHMAYEAGLRASTDPIAGTGRHLLALARIRSVLYPGGRGDLDHGADEASQVNNILRELGFGPTPGTDHGETDEDDEGDPDENARHGRQRCGIDGAS